MEWQFAAAVCLGSFYFLIFCDFNSISPIYDDSVLILPERLPPAPPIVAIPKLPTSIGKAPSIPLLIDILDSDNEPDRIARAAFKETKKYPFTFGISQTKFLPATEPTNAEIANLSASKTLQWATLIPGQQNTYIYGTDEAAYYRGYQQAWKAHTWKKAGFDCYRHLEIIVNGCIPVFRDTKLIPTATMFAYPKKLMAHVEQHSDEASVQVLATWRFAFLSWAHRHLSAAAMVRYMARMTGTLDELERGGRALFVDSAVPSDPDYGSLTVVLGLIEWLGHDRVDVLYDIPFIYNGGDIPQHRHGSGVSYSRLMDRPAAMPTEKVMLERLAGKQYAVVAYGEFDRSSKHFEEVRSAGYSAERVWLMDGNDTPEGWNFPTPPNVTVFQREIWATAGPTKS